MKTATKTGAKQKVLTSGDVCRMIDEAAARREKVMDLSWRTIRSIELHHCDVPVSLDLHGAAILGGVWIMHGKFTGDYIDLDDARVGGKVMLTALGEKEFSLFLRRARLCTADASEVAVRLTDVSLAWLCIGGLRVGKGLRQIEMTNVRLDGRISFEPNAGIHVD